MEVQKVQHGTVESTGQDVQKLDVGHSKTEFQDVQKLDGINTNNINTNISILSNQQQKE